MYVYIPIKKNGVCVGGGGGGGGLFSGTFTLFGELHEIIQFLAVLIYMCYNVSVPHPEHFNTFFVNIG